MHAIFLISHDSVCALRQLHVGLPPNAADITPTGLAPTEAMKSAILTILDPVAYTVIVRGFNSATGVGIVEVLAQ